MKDPGDFIKMYAAQRAREIAAAREAEARAFLRMGYEPHEMTVLYRGRDDLHGEVVPRSIVEGRQP